MPKQFFGACECGADVGGGFIPGTGVKGVNCGYSSGITAVHLV